MDQKIGPNQTGKWSKSKIPNFVLSTQIWRTQREKPPNTLTSCDRSSKYFQPISPNDFADWKTLYVPSKWSRPKIVRFSWNFHDTTLTVNLIDQTHVISYRCATHLTYCRPNYSKPQQFSNIRKTNQLESEPFRGTSGSSNNVFYGILSSNNRPPWSIPGTRPRKKPIWTKR